MYIYSERVAECVRVCVRGCWRAAQRVLIVLIRDALCLISFPAEKQKLEDQTRGINDVTVSSYAFPEPPQPRFSRLCTRLRQRRKNLPVNLPAGGKKQHF